MFMNFRFFLFHFTHGQGGLKEKREWDGSKLKKKAPARNPNALFRGGLLLRSEILAYFNSGVY